MFSLTIVLYANNQNIKMKKKNELFIWHFRLEIFLSRLDINGPEHIFQ